jgi:Tol biopolymer transport system component
MERLTEGVSVDAYPSVSADGKKLVYLSPKSGKWAVRTRDLETGREMTVATTAVADAQPKISGDSSTIIYWHGESESDRADYVVGFNGGPPQKLCGGRCGPPTSLSRDGKKVLLESVGFPDAILLADIPSSTVTELVRPEGESFAYAARFSPDERWISFHLRDKNATARQVFIVPLRQGKTPPRNQWIAATDGSAMDRESYWAPDGKRLYFLSERDGFRCIWAQALQPETKQPVGPAFAVSHFHHARRSLAGVGGSPGSIGFSATSDSLVFALAELTGNIWIAKP